MKDWEKTKKDFLNYWTIEKVKNMTLEEYTNLDKKNSFTYWMETKSADVIGIGGGFSYMFGIFRRENIVNLKSLQKGKGGDDEHGWFTKYGKNKDEVFQKVKSLIIAIIEYSKNREFNKIDDIDLGNTYKWKIAFMYAPNESLLRIASDKTFFFLAKKYFIDSKLISEIQKELIAKKPLEMDFDDYSLKLWEEFQEKINYEKKFSEWNLKEPTRNGENIPKNRNKAMIEKLKKTIPKLIKENINLFEMDNIEKLKNIKKRFLKEGDLESSMNGNNNANCSSSLHRYIMFLESINKQGNEINSEDDNEEIDLTESDNLSKEENQAIKKQEIKEQYTNEPLGDLDFPHKNLLLKGVPGTGKSKTIDNIIENDLDMNSIIDNVLRINIHSASSNSDLMQGISISTDGENNILYQEKKGAVLKHIFKAMFKPKQPFVLVLEEIQENSLNELIGDLIYLIEKDKRTEIKLADDQELSYEELFEKVNPRHFVELPNLVEGSESNIKMIMPDNLYIFCTSNYRDDKKVIEDNLLRRFDVVEIYPQTQEELGEEIFKSKEVSDFLSELNRLIEEQFENETHPDRYLVGHANWLSITDEENEDNKKLFYTALLKVLVEFKEIREVDFETYVRPILEELVKESEHLSDQLKQYIDECNFEYKSYKEMVEKLQKKIYNFVN